MEPFDASVSEIRYPDVILVKHRDKNFTFFKKLNGTIGVR